MKRKTKECLGCGANFLTLKNYDYCQGCGINGGRYVNKTKKPTKLSEEEREEQFWDEVNQLAQEKIYQLLTKNIPFQNIPLIKEPWKFEDRQQKLSGLFLDRDVDYRTLLSDIESQSSKATSDKDYLTEEIAVWYCRMVMKSLISDLSGYSGYDPSFFSNLTSNEY